MDDLKQQLRRHYEDRALSAGRVQDFLALGRAAAAARTSRVRWWYAAAASVILIFGIFGATKFFRGRAGLPLITTTAVAGEVVRYFADPNYQLPQVSADRRVLVGWLRQHGGPDSFEVPPAMAGLSSYGCQVLEVQGQKVYLICFLLEAPPANAPPGAMPEKKMMVTVGPDGQMMKKNRPLVHLVVAPKSLFAGAPQPGERIALPAAGDWNFTAWSAGDQVFIAAAVLPADRLAGLVQAL